MKSIKPYPDPAHTLCFLTFRHRSSRNLIYCDCNFSSADSTPTVNSCFKPLLLQQHQLPHHNRFCIGNDRYFLSTDSAPTAQPTSVITTTIASTSTLPLNSYNNVYASTAMHTLQPQSLHFNHFHSIYNFRSFNESIASAASPSLKSSVASQAHLTSQYSCDFVSQPGTSSLSLS